jgi:LAO/AO transport system kinase
MLTCSAVKGQGIAELWQLVEKFHEAMTESGEWTRRRLRQVEEGLIEFAREKVLTGMLSSPVVQKDLDQLGAGVAAGTMTLRTAASKIAGDFLQERREG